MDCSFCPSFFFYRTDPGIKLLIKSLLTDALHFRNKILFKLKTMSFLAHISFDLFISDNVG